MKKWFRIALVLAVPVVLLLSVGLFFFCKYADNTTLQLTTYRISHEKIPVQFQGFRIAQISDLHNAEFGEDNIELISLLKESSPDIIVLTGDQLDARKTDIDVVLTFLRQAVQIAPCYLVTGNHEGSITETPWFQTQIAAVGVTVLADQVTTLSRDGAQINLIGLNDATTNKRFYTHGAKVALDMTLQELDWDTNLYSVLITHRPEYLYVYERNGIDLALCGHVHGGQIRINGRGLVGPGKELFPEYDNGVYTLDDATMVVSRGLGNSLFPWRINNPPEVVIVEFGSDE